MALVGLVVMGILAMVVLAEEDLVDLMEVAQQVAHMVVAGELAEENRCLEVNPTSAAETALSALSVSSGALAVAIRRTPQTSN